jgi:hypothetical protein
MFNTFADAFNTDGNTTKKMNGTNPFDSPSSTTDPFGISSDMKISESSEKFDDNPFKTTDTSVRPRSGKEALSSSNWLAYQHSMDEANLDSIEDLQEASLITQTNNINLKNPFLVSTTDNTSQNFTTDFLSNSNTNSTINSKNPFEDFDQNSAAYDPFGLNQTNTSTAFTTKVTESDSFTDISKSNQNQTFASQPIVPPSNSEVNNQFMDWFTQPDNFTSGIDSKKAESTAKNDINAINNNNNTDFFGSTHRTPQLLSTLRMYSK